MAIKDSQINPRRASLNDIVGAYKSLTAIQYLRWIQLNQPERPAKLWQRGYYERIVRSESQLYAYRSYIQANAGRHAVVQ